MSLLDWTCDNDHFEPEDGGFDRFSFPCNACKHRQKQDSDEPCRSCGHNIVAVMKQEKQCGLCGAGRQVLEKKIERLQDALNEAAEIRQRRNMLARIHAIIVAAIVSEDGLDGDDGHEILEMLEHLDPSLKQPLNWCEAAETKGGNPMSESGIVRAEYDNGPGSESHKRAMAREALYKQIEQKIVAGRKVRDERLAELRSLVERLQAELAEANGEA